jgi:internalin A
MSERALQRIREAKEQRLTELNLSQCDLTEIPKEVSELTWLETLNLWGNKELSDLTPLTNLTQLQQLNVFDTQVSDLTPLTNLTQLQKLNVFDTQVSDLMPLTNLAQLQLLDVSETEVRDLTPLTNLTQLQQLDVRSTKVRDLTPLTNLTQLQQFNASYTKVRDLTPLTNLTQLQQLSVSYTQVSDLTPLTNLTLLKQFDVFSTQVRDLTPLRSLTQLKGLRISGTKVIDLTPLKDLIQLQQLYVHDTDVSDLTPLKGLNKLRDVRFHRTKVNDLTPLKLVIGRGIPVKVEACKDDCVMATDCPLINPPKEIVEQGNAAILNYWQQAATQGVETINEAKIIIVGEGKSGKTTLFHKLIDPNYAIKSLDETHGINIHEGLELKNGFRANLWDFGGQALQYMTHQFFLTPRALYVLLMNPRAESPNLSYWFKIISLLGKHQDGEKIKLILVANKHKGDTTGTPQYQTLLNYYKADFDEQYFDVNLGESNTLWQALKEGIEDSLANLPIVKNPLPKKWKVIREALRDEWLIHKRPYITSERLAEICEPFGLTEEAQQFLLTGYLHQLGSILHFKEDKDLMNTIFLSPEWVVEGVYTTLKSELIEKKKGKFSQTDIFNILKSKGYKEREAQKILQLMSKNNFDICYQANDGDYVAAQLLDKENPFPNIWHTHTGALRFRYEYPIMPQGLMCRLIVRFGDKLENHEGIDVVWKKGAILNLTINGTVCRVLMHEDDNESPSGVRQILIEVMEETDARHNRKYALQLVRQELEDLHKRWFKNIKYEEFVPCNCTVCKLREDPWMYKYSDLKKLKIQQTFCYHLEGMVDLRQILEGVYIADEGKLPTSRKREHDERGMPDIHVHIENKPQFTNTIHNNGVNEEDMQAIKDLLAQLTTETKAGLKTFVETLPEAEDADDKQTYGKQIIKWLNKNAEGIVGNVAASVYYDTMKHLLEIG